MPLTGGNIMAIINLTKKDLLLGYVDNNLVTIEQNGIKYKVLYIYDNIAWCKRY